MENLTISIFENQFLLKTLKEIKLFSNFKINYYDNLDLLLKNSLDKREVVILFDNAKNHKNLQLLIKSNIPIVIRIATVEQINKKISIIFSTFSLARKFFSIFRKTIRAVIKKTNKDKKKIKFLDTENSGYK